jgi:PAS domain S-box-containing protein
MRERPPDPGASLRTAIEAEHALIIERMFGSSGGAAGDAELAARYLVLLRDLKGLPREHLLGLRLISDLRDARPDHAESPHRESAPTESAEELVLFRRLADTSGYGFAVADARGFLTYANRALCRMYGEASPAATVGRSMAGYLPEERQEDFEARILPAALKVGQWVGELPVRSADGSLTPTIQNIFVVRGEQGGPLRVASLVIDITARKQAEEALRHSEENFRALAENARDMIVITVEEGRLVYANRRAEIETGHDLDKLLTMHMRDLIAPEEIERLTGYYRQRLRGDPVPVLYETCGVHRDGHRVPIEIAAARTTWHGLPAVLVVARDIRLRKEAEAALRQSEENFRSLVENAHDGVLIAAGLGQHIYANRRAAEITGYSVEELLGIGFRELAHPDDLPRMRGYYEARIASGSAPGHYETRIIRKDGTIVPVEVTAARTLWEGAPADIIFVRDITLRKQAQQALRESEEKYRELVENIDDVAYSIDREGRVTYVSPSVHAVVGFTPEEAIGQHFANFLAPEDLPDLTAQVGQILAGNPPGPSEWRLKVKGGGLRWMRSATRPIYEKGRIVGMRGVMVDIHDRRMAEEALRETEALYATVIKDARLGVAIVQNERIEYVNPTIAGFVGYAPEELIGQPYVVIIPPEDRPSRAETHRQRMQGGEAPRTFPVEVLHKNGSRVRLENTASVVQYHGRPAMLVVVRDIGAPGNRPEPRP